MTPDADRLGEPDALDGVPVPAETLQVRGQDAALASLTEAFESGRLHHAWLLQGPKGIGKATLAFAFARRVLEASGAGAASVAARVAAGTHPNLLHLTRPPAERGGFRSQITVDEVRRLNRFFQTSAAAGGWRIAILDPIDDLNRNAANALLKTLEEPPARALFLLVNHLPGRLLPTVRSRCRMLTCEPLTVDVVASVLSGLDGVAASPEDREAAARASGDSVRNAILRLRSGAGEWTRDLDALARATSPDWGGILALADKLTARDAETAFAFAVDELLDGLARDAADCAVAGRRDAARALAALWQEETGRFREGALYNLDRRQMLLTHFQRRFATD